MHWYLWSGSYSWCLLRIVVGTKASGISWRSSSPQLRKWTLLTCFKKWHRFPLSMWLLRTLADWKCHRLPAALYWRHWVISLILEQDDDLLPSKIFIIALLFSINSHFPKRRTAVIDNKDLIFSGIRRTLKLHHRIIEMTNCCHTCLIYESAPVSNWSPQNRYDFSHYPSILNGYW